MKTNVLHVFCRCLIVAAVTAWAALVPWTAEAHSPVLDACTCDWCFFTTPGPDDTSAFLNCNLRENTASPPPNCVCSAPTNEVGAELVWYDDEADNLIVNDIANIASTWDEENFYLAAALYNDPDPQTPPAGQVAISVGPAGNSEWRDNFSSLGTDDDLGADASPVILADYLVVFDFSEFVFNGGITVCPGSPGCANPYGQVYESTTTPGSWTLLAEAIVAVDPGLLGGSGGPPGKIEALVPWSAFASCEACPEFGPGDEYRLTFMVAEGGLSLPPSFEPGGPIEDLITETVAGTFTTTQDSCPTGAGTTNCELADSSSDAFIPGGVAAGEIPPTLTGRLETNGDVTLDWSASCVGTDVDYEVYEGSLGDPLSHVPVTCTTGGLTTATFPPSAGDRFYLVVPTNGSNEGSYGSDSDGNQRPTSALACRAKVRTTCP